MAVDLLLIVVLVVPVRSCKYCSRCLVSGILVDVSGEGGSAYNTILCYV